MKKILSIFAAGALALGLIGCSGDLHEVPDGMTVDLSEGAVPGAFNGWDNKTKWTTVSSDKTTYTYNFVASDTSVEWKAITTSGNWNSGAYIDAEIKANDGETKLKFDNKSGGGDNAKITGLTKTLAYKLTVRVDILDVYAKVESADIASYYLVADGKLSTMAYKADGTKSIYTATITPASSTLEMTISDGKDNYGTSADAVAMPATDTDDKGATTASEAVTMAKYSTTVTKPVTFTGLKLNENVTPNVYYEYVVTVTVDGTSKDVTITRVIPKHKVTFEITASGLAEGDFVYINGSPWSWGGNWPFTGWNGGDAKKTEECLKLTDKFGTADAEGKVKFGNVELDLEDGKKINDWAVKFVSIKGSDPTAYECGFEYANGSVPEFTPLNGKNSTFKINVRNTGSAYEVTISEPTETPAN